MITQVAKWYLSRNATTPEGQIDLALNTFSEARDSLVTAMERISQLQADNDAEVAEAARQLALLRQEKEEANHSLGKQYNRASHAVSKLSDILGVAA